jgi:hypothetical protein
VQRLPVTEGATFNLSVTGKCLVINSSCPYSCKTHLFLANDIFRGDGNRIPINIVSQKHQNEFYKNRDKEV